MSTQPPILFGGTRINSPFPFQARFGLTAPGSTPGAGQQPLTFRLLSNVKKVQPWRVAPEIRRGQYDVNLTQTLRGDVVVPFNSNPRVELGIVEKAARYAHMKVNGLNPDGTVIDAGTLNSLLVLVSIYVRADGGTIYRFDSQPALGIVFFVDFKGGEVLDVVVDNTNFLSTLDGATLQFQLFVNSDPRFDIETSRKGNPDT